MFDERSISIVDLTAGEVDPSGRSFFFLGYFSLPPTPSLSFVLQE